MRWAAVELNPVEINSHGYAYVCSKVPYMEYYLLIEVFRCSKNGIHVLFHGSCKCKKMFLKEKVTVVPYNKNSIVVMCYECEQPMMRVSGFVNSQWKMEVPL